MSVSAHRKIINSEIPPTGYGVVRIWVVLFVWFFSSFGVVGQNPVNIPPTFNHIKRIDLPDFTLNDSNTEDITVAIATDSQGNIYTLSFGNGVSKRNAEGVVVDQNFISESALSSPLDIAINNEGFVYIADYSETSCDQNGKIKVFDPNGVLVNIIYTQFYRPIGIDIADNNNIYVAEYNAQGSGCESDELSRISIYNPEGARLNYTNNVNRPFRIAVNSIGEVYVSQAGTNGNGSVRIYNENLVYQNVLPNIVSPGSIVIDEFDYIYIIEYAGRVDFRQFLNFEELSKDYNKILEISKQIYLGQKGQEFKIKYYSPNNSYINFIQEKINFPVDLAFNNCNRLYVNNSEIKGLVIPNPFATGGITFVPTSLEFSLEVYRRTPSFDQEKPNLSCPSDMVVTAPAGQNSSQVNFANPTVTDNCSFTVAQTIGDPPGSQFPIGTHTIEFTATDSSGNKDTCSFTITVNPAEEEPDTIAPVITCPANITQTADPSTCGAVIIYATPTATDNSGSATVTLKSGIVSGGTFPLGVTTVIYEAVDSAGNNKECSFTVTIKDNEKPIIACPANLTKEIPADQNSVIVEFDKPAPTDNCSGVTVTQTKGQASGSQFNVGEHGIEFTATDETGNSATCSFMITVNKEEVDNPPVFTNCSTSTISKNNDPGKCGAIVSFSTPTATDDKGTPTVVRTDDGPLSGELFPIGTYTIVFEASDGVNDPVICSFQIVVTDNEKPVITCPANITKEIPADQNSVIVEFNNPVPSDNCSGATVTQTKGQVSGSQFTVGDHEIEFTVKDAAGNLFACSFTITIKQEEVDNPPAFENCPTTPISKNNDPWKCGAIVTFSTPTATDDQGTPTVVRIDDGPLSGEFFPIGIYTIVFEASDGVNDSVICSFQIVVTDNEKPQFTNQCEGVDYTANFEVGENFTMPNFYDQFPATDNCTSEINFVQDPPPGTTISQEGTYPVKLTIKDDFGNSNTCSFNVILTSSDDLSFSCNSQFILQPDENCEYVLPNLSEEYLVSPSDALVTQSIQQGQILNQDTEVTLTATYGDQTLTCKIKVILVDYVYPVISCLPTQYVTNTPAEGFVLPDYVQQIQYSDNCEIASVVQEPTPGTLINNNQIVRITVTDAFGNSVHCIFDVYLSEEEDPLEISCLADQSAQLDSNCEFLVPDYTSMANVNISDAVVTQNPPAGTTLNSNTSISLIAIAGNQSVTCDFQLILEDNTAPTLVCPPDQWENYDPANDFALPDYRGLAIASDACGIAQIQQSPSPGINITQNTTVSFSVTDLSGNSITCAFTVNLTQEEVVEISCPEDQVVETLENCSFTLRDYTNMAGVNFEGAQVTQAPAPGTQISGNTTVILTATLNGQTDSCAFDVYSEDNTAPVANCIATGGYRLDQNGNVALTAEQINNGSTDNCGIVNMELNRTDFTTADIGDHTIRLTVKDAAGNTDSCETTISIWPYVGTGNEFTCKTNFILELDETGNATLSAEDLYTGDPQDRQFSLSKTEFSCENIGENNVTLSYTGSSGTGSCEVIVQVKDSQAPAVIARNIIVTLDSENRAIITSQMVDNGSSDNCSVTLSLDQTVFGCKDLGEKTVTLTGTDSSGNSATATAVVTVIGDCDDPPIPVEGVDHIFIYPNPTPGPFKFATPTGMTIDRVEAFDARGRFIVAKTFDDNLREYQMDLTGVEQAVYFLKIFSSDGVKILRVIIK